MLFNTPFAEFAAILVVAAVVGAVGGFLRQPLIVSFIGVGILVGPAGIGLVTQHEEIELLASFGISLLLFVVGLKLDLTMVRTIGPVALATGVGQIVFTSVIGFVIAVMLGMETVTAVYVAIALTFSSTIIVVKLLSDKREIDALHGRIAVGFLIVQDVAVILAMIGITAIGADRGGDQNLLAHTAMIVVKGVGFVAGVIALAVWVLPRLLVRFARSVELLVLVAIALAFGFSAIGAMLGFSKEIGAFLAGAALAPSPFREAIAGRLVSVRDFLLLFFFIDLGARLDLSLLGTTAIEALIFSVFVLIGNPLIVMVIMGAMGYGKRTGFLAGLTVAQISEFSLILAALGVSVGHISPETMGMITSVALITIALSTYMILYSGPLYERVAPWLRIFERRVPYRELGSDLAHQAPPDIVVLGLGRYGSGIVRHLLQRGRRVIGIDFDPQALERWRAEGVPVLYGDANDPGLFDHVPLRGVKWVVATTPDLDTSRILLHHLQATGYTGRIAIAARNADESDRLRLDGASLVLRPYADAAEQAADALTSAVDRLAAILPVTPGLREVRLGSGSTWAGHRLSEIALRDQFGTMVLVVSRAGRSFVSPGPDFQLFPGDRLFLSGEPAALDRASAELARLDPIADDDSTDEDFHVEEVVVGDVADWVGRTLAELGLPTRFGVMVVAATHGDAKLGAPDPHHRLQAEDRLVLGAPLGALEGMRKG